MKDCIFCRITEKKLPAEIVFENDEIMAFKTIQPVAPVHILIVPKKHIDSIDHLEDIDLELAGKLILVARDLARDLNISQKGYKLMFHVGEYGGQEIYHLHLHLIGGANIREEIKIINE